MHTLSNIAISCARINSYGREAKEIVVEFHTTLNLNAYPIGVVLRGRNALILGTEVPFLGRTRLVYYFAVLCIQKC